MKSFFTVIFFFVFINCSLSGEIIISGIYQGKNVYVQNPFSPEKKQFCTDEVFVNEEKVLSEIKNSAYTINLSHLDFGSPVAIRITHKNDCTPRIVNAFVIQSPDQSYTFIDTYIKDKLIKWSLKEKVLAGRFIIEKYNSNYWKPIGTIAVLLEEADYNFNVEQFISSGTNKFRIKYLSPKEQVFISSNILFESKPESVTFSLTGSNKILLSKETSYEIIDEDGNKVTNGKGNEIAISNLNPGVYYINYSNKSEKFQKN